MRRKQSRISADLQPGQAQSSRRMDRYRLEVDRRAARKTSSRGDGEETTRKEPGHREDSSAKQLCRRPESSKIDPLLGFEVKSLERPGGHAGRKRKCRNLPRNHSVGADHCAFTNRRTGTYDHTIPKPDVTADDDLPIGNQWPQEWRNA